MPAQHCPPPTARRFQRQKPCFLATEVPTSEQEVDAETLIRRSAVREVPRRDDAGSSPSLDETQVYARPAAPPIVTEPAARNQVIDTRYRIDGVIGEGGMARVLLATHVHLGSHVCIKQMHANLAQDREYVARFLREARASAGLKSPHAIRIQDIGISRSGIPYMVMERLEGSDLHELVVTHGPLGAADVATLMTETCDAVGEAHGHGVVHRDLKPANLFLSRSGRGPGTIKVLDFGVASGDGSAGSALTQPHAFLGSPQFMAPEQSRSARSASPRSDVWSLGVTMYFLFTGVVPFTGPSVGAVLQAVQQGAYVPLEQLRPDVSPRMLGIIRRCLALDPALRPADARELGAMLRAVHTGHSSWSVRPVEARTLRPGPTVGRLPRWAVILGGLVLTALGSVVMQMAAQHTATVCAAILAGR
jgi:eukaryotic-like serine/threonine-protein kinase